MNYKVQEWQQEVKILGITFRRKWKVFCFRNFDNITVTFRRLSEFQCQVTNFIITIKR